MTETETARIVADNARYADGFRGPGSNEPSRRLAIVACMDTRIDPYRAFGLQAGEVHLLRNAGGQITDDVLRSLAISQRSLGTREIVVVHHTGCGVLDFDDDAFRAELAAETGQQPPWRVPGFTDLPADVRASLRRVRECPWLPHRDAVHGFVFDVATGRLDDVE